MKNLKEAVVSANKLHTPLQIVGVVNTCCALLAKQAGFKALYLSGAGVANAAFGLPDLGMTTFTEVTEEIRRITQKVKLPLLVDGDTGWGGTLTIERMVKEFSTAGASAVHIEDQVWPKRCGHRAGKQVVSSQEMCDRIKAAVDARTHAHFSIMARTDALASEGLSSAVARAVAYVDAGADMIFAEAITQLHEYHDFVKALPPTVPVLANITEFGKTPLFTVDELKSVGVQMVLYPLSAFRVMNKAALELYQTIRSKGSQKDLISNMQTREELYSLLDYYKYEERA